LAAHVLKIANSAGFGGRTEIVSLQQAVARLGMRLLAEIALAVSMGGVFAVPGQERRVAQMWRRSLAAGLWAKEVARVGRRNVESAFLGGLLHRIGEPVALREAVLEAARSTDPPDEESMLSTVEQFAPEVGERIATAWKLPAVTRSCIVHHEYPEYAGAFVLDVWAVAFADAFASGQSDVSEHPAVEPLNLYPEDLEHLEGQRERVEAALEAMCA
jgi:HD-like signal output (HDOD) protein